MAPSLNIRKYDKNKIFEEAKKLRDLVNSKNEFKFDLSDEKIREIIDKKYDTYCLSKTIFDNRAENMKINSSKFKDAGSVSNLSSIELQTINAYDQEEIDTFIKQNNSYEKHINYRIKAVQEVSKADFAKVFDGLSSPSKSVEFLAQNEFLVSVGYRSSFYGGSTLRNEETELGLSMPKEIANAITDKSQQSLFQAPFFDLMENARMCASAVWMLFEEDRPKLSEEDHARLFGSIINDIGKQGGEFEQYFGPFQNIGKCSDDRYDKAKENLEKMNLKESLSHFKPAEPNMSYIDALIEGKGLVRKDQTEIDNLENSFNKYGGKVKLAKGLTEKTSDQIEDIKNKNIEKLFDANTKYSKINPVARFFSHFLPNSMTQSGRLRNEQARISSELAGMGISRTEINERLDYLKEASKITDIRERIDRQIVDGEIISEEDIVEKKHLTLEELANQQNSSKEMYEKENGKEASMSNEIVNDINRQNNM